MKPYIEWTKEELVAEKARLEQEFAEVKAKGLNLNISRGKPAAAQLDLTEGMLTVLSKNEDTFAEDGTDCRNYGVLTGIPEARKLIGDICEVPAKNVIVYGNASLTIMFDTVARSFLKGVAASHHMVCSVVLSLTVYLSLGDLPVNFPVFTATAPVLVTMPFS